MNRLEKIVKEVLFERKRKKKKKKKRDRCLRIADRKYDKPCCSRCTRQERIVLTSE